MSGAGGRQAAQPWHASLAATLRTALTRALPDGAEAARAIAVPDHWPEGPSAEPWALPRALAAAGWLPGAFVREAAAALATWAPSPRRPVVVVSLGAGPARLTVWTAGERAWRSSPGHAAVLAGVSGEILRRRLGQIACDEIVRLLKRDPAEHAREDQEVRNGVELVLDELAAGGDATFRAAVFGTNVVLPVARTALLDCCGSFREDLRRALAALGPALGKFDLLCWGELTALVPIRDWLAGIDGLVQVETAAFHAVAAGAARIAALVDGGGVDVPASAGVDPASGRVRPAGGGVPLIDAVPLELLPAGARAEAWLVEVETGRRHAIGQVLRVGRDPRLELSFESTRFPEVGRHHFTVFRVGEEFELRDEESRNGTYVNGEARREPHRLAAGDRILAGPNGPPLVFEMDRS